MRRLPAVIVAIILCLAFYGCRRGTENPSELLEELRSGGSDEILAGINRAYGVLYGAGCYDSVFSLYRDIFRIYPASLSGDSDGILYETGEAIRLFYGAAYHSGKLPEFLRITDSLAVAQHPYLTESARHYLMAYRCIATDTDGSEYVESMIDEALAMPPAADVTQEEVFAHLIGRVLRFAGRPADDYIAMQERAVKALKAGGKYRDGADVLSQAGYFYNRIGQYEKGAQYLQDGIAYIEKHPDNSGMGVIHLYCDLANLYYRLGMTDKAVELNETAIRKSIKAGNILMPDLLRMRSVYYSETGQADSALVYSAKALKAADAMTDSAVASTYRNVIIQNRAIFLVEQADVYPDSLSKARKVLEIVCSDSTRTNTTARFVLGLAYAKEGDALKGIPMMEKATDEFIRQQYGESIAYAYGWLMKIYAENGMDKKMKALFPHFDAMRDSIHNAEKNRAAIASNIRYATGRREAENSALMNEVALRERSMFYGYMVVALVIILLAGSIVYFVKRRGSMRREQELHREQLDNLLMARQELNRRTEAIYGEMKQLSNPEADDEIRGNAEYLLLSTEDERRFRRSFTALYPKYLPELRRRCEALTKSDELFCMLIYLRQSTDEIALALGISRASVNSGRSRIRKKLGLTKDESLEEALGCR